MTAPVKMLLIFIDETDTHGELPLYEAILRRLTANHMAGATVNAGIMGFGSHHKIHRKRLFGVSDDRPIAITIVDEEAKIRAILPEMRKMVKEGLMLLLDAEVVN